MSIEVKQITKLYGKQKALDNVSLSINEGEIVGLLGPNGAGKSTLMKIITCFMPPTSGNVKVHDLDIFEDSMEIRKRIGYLPETNPLYYDMYVKEFLHFIAGIHNLGKNRQQRIEEMIALTGLEPEMHKKIGALSKGYKQRVGLAQALIHDPEVLILDEPTSGLDPNQIIEIRNLIKEISLKKTILLSTHIMQEVDALCNRVIIINKGKIVADDSTDKLSSIISEKEIINVEFNEKVNEKNIADLKGIKSVSHTKGNAYSIEASGNEDVRAILFQYAVDNNLKVLSLSKKVKSIEQVFQQLTNE